MELVASGVPQESEAEDSLQGLEDIPEGWEFRGRRESYYSYYEAVLGLDTGAMTCGTGCFEKAKGQVSIKTKHNGSKEF